jgi:hypothetical protein
MNGMLLSGLKSARKTFAEEGILFYPAIFEGDELERLRVACDYVLDQHMADLESRSPEDANISHSMRHLSQSCWHRQTREHWKVIMETVADPRCLGPVEQIFTQPSLFRCTSLFFNPRGGGMEGNWHRDPQFTHKEEAEVKAYLESIKGASSTNGLQFQIALVDNDDVEYVPFSAARYDAPEEYKIRCEDDRSHNRESGMPNAMRVHLRAGDAVIFNPNGLHRGRYWPQNPRRTLMLTYTPSTQPHCDFFSKQPWMLEPGYLDGLSPRARVYFEEFIATYRDFWLQ